MIPFDIIASGSSGNAVMLGGTVLIDVGVPFRRLQKYIPYLQLVLTTHVHTDHFNPSTVRKLIATRPTLRFGCAAHMVPYLLDARVPATNIDVFEPYARYDYGLVGLECFPLHHDVPNVGYKLHFDMGQPAGIYRVIYATDTSRLDHITAKDYDLYLIEGNHNIEDMMETIASKRAAGQFIYESNAMHRHMSEEAAIGWLMENMGNHSQYVLMHRHGM